METLFPFHSLSDRSLSAELTNENLSFSSFCDDLFDPFNDGTVSSSVSPDEIVDASVRFNVGQSKYYLRVSYRQMIPH